MKTQKRNRNRQLYGACLSIIIFAVFSSLPVLGNSYFRLNSDTGEHVALSKNNLSTANFAAKNDRGITVARSPLISKHSNRHFARLSSLRHPATIYSKRKVKKTISLRRSGKIHINTRKRLLDAASPLPNKLFALLGNSVQMEALHFRPNALLPAKANWKDGIDSIIQPYINGTEEYDSVLVVGYTDNTGSAQGNLQLSAERAKKIAAYLAQKGIPEDRIHIVAVGEHCPVASNKNSIGRNANRRVEINFLKGT